MKFVGGLEMRKSEGAVALLQSHLTEWTVWIPSIPWGEILVKFSLWMTLKCLLQVDRLFHHKWNLNTKLTLILFCEHSNIKYTHTYIHTCIYVCVSVYIRTKSVLLMIENLHDLCYHICQSIQVQMRAVHLLSLGVNNIKVVLFLLVHCFSIN